MKKIALLALYMKYRLWSIDFLSFEVLKEEFFLFPSFRIKFETISSERFLYCSIVFLKYSIVTTTFCFIKK